MDTRNTGRYSHCMSERSKLVVLAILGMLAPVSMAAPRALAVLEYKSGLLGDRSVIYERVGGAPSPFRGKPKKVWTLREGDTVRQNTPPPERLIRFYETINNNSISICTIIVKYSRSGKGWRPSYQLLTHPLIAVENGKIKPVGTDEGVRGMVQLLRGNEPNHDGFFHTIQFGVAEGAITIDSWEVQ